MDIKEGNQPNDKEVNCKYCYESIHRKAKVCSHCGKYQNIFFNNIFSINTLTTIISILLLVLAYFQYRDSSIEKENSQEASKTSSLALEKVIESENRVLNVTKDIVKASQAIVEIADILPEATGYGQGLTETQRIRLKELSKSLKDMIKKINTENKK